LFSLSCYFRSDTDTTTTDEDIAGDNIAYGKAGKNGKDQSDDAENYFDDYEETGKFYLLPVLFYYHNFVSFFPNYQW